METSRDAQEDVRNSMKTLSFETLLSLKAAHPDLFESVVAAKRPQHRKAPHSDNEREAPALLERKASKPVSQKRVIFKAGAKKSIDPRFEEYTGKLNKEKFLSAYTFIEDLKKKELGDINKNMKSKNYKKKIGKPNVLKMKQQRGDIVSDLKALGRIRAEKEFKLKLKSEGSQKLTRKEYKDNFNEYAKNKNK